MDKDGGLARIFTFPDRRTEDNGASSERGVPSPMHPSVMYRRQLLLDAGSEDPEPDTA